MKQNYKKVIIYTFSLFIVLFLVLIISAQKLINLNSLKTRIVNKIEDKSGGDFNIDKIEISLFPYVNIVARNVKFVDDNNKLKGNLDNISIYPKLLPLLRKKIEISKVVINSPVLDLELQDDVKTIKMEESTASVLHTLDEKLKNFISLFPHISKIQFSINNGKINLNKHKENILKFSNVGASYIAGNGNAGLTVRCSSDFSREIRFKVDLDVKQSLVKGLIEIKKAEPSKLLKYLYPGTRYKVRDSEIDFAVYIDPYDFSPNVAKNIKGNISGKLYKLSLINLEDQIALKEGIFKGTFDLGVDEYQFSIEELNLDNPKLNLNGELSVSRSPQSVSLKIGGYDIDVSSARKISQSFFSKSDLADKIFNILRDGNIELIELNSQAISFKELYKDGNYRITASMNNGEIYIPKLDWIINDVRGEAQISDEILKGTNLGGRHKNNLAHSGILTIGLSKKQDVFQLKTDVEGDAKDIPSYLRQFIKDKKLLNEIELLKNIKGSINGKLSIGDKKSSMEFGIDSSILNFSADYKRIPYPITIKEGRFLYHKSKLKATHINGNISASVFSNLSLNYDWQNDNNLEISSLNANLSLDELYPWLSSFDETNNHLRKFKTLKGKLKISDLTFKGSPVQPDDWIYGVKGEGFLINKHKTTFSGDLKRDKKQLTVNKFNIDDEYSKAEFKLKYRERLEHLEFTGNVMDSTLDNIFESNKYFDGYVKGDISIDFDKSSLTANGNLESKNQYCGLVANGKIDVSSLRSVVNYHLNNQEKQLGSTVECITSKTSPVTGKYEFKVDINTQGKANNLGQLIQGKYSFISKGGTISRREGLFSKILSILNVSSLFKGKIGSLRDKNLNYTEIKSDGIIENGRLILKNAEMYGASTGILANGYIDPIDKNFDLHLKATPLESIDVIMRKIPLVKRFETKRFLFIPIHVEGWFGDPEVKSAGKTENESPPK